MSFDGFLMRAVQGEFRERLLAARVERVFQPDAHTITLVLYPGRQDTLLLSIHPELHRVQRTARPPANPAQPPAFCMLLRKHLEGLRLLEVEQAGWDRVLTLHFGRGTESRRLVLEMLGRRGQLVLLDQDGTILAAWSGPRSPAAHRTRLRAGEPYALPPAGEKLPPERASADALRQAWAAGQAAGWAAAARDTTAREGEDAAVERRQDVPAWRWLVAYVAGLGPVLAREAVFRAGCDPALPLPPPATPPSWPERLAAVVQDWAEAAAAGRFAPTWLVTDAGRPPDGPPPAPVFAAFGLTPQAHSLVQDLSDPGQHAPGRAAGAGDGARGPQGGKGLPGGEAGGLLRHLSHPSGPQPPPDPCQAGQARVYSSASALLDDVYGDWADRLRFWQRRQDLRQALRTPLQRARRKEAVQELELREAEDAEQWRQAGELLTAHLPQVPRGASEVELPDYYDYDAAGGRRRLLLDPRLSPAANAQAYFRRYQKARRRAERLQEELVQTRLERQFLEQLEEDLNNAVALEELEDVAALLGDPGGQGAAGAAPGRGAGTSAGWGPGAISGRRQAATPQAGREPRAARRGGRQPGKNPDGAAERPERRRAASFLKVSLGGGWQAWIGRNSQMNDELTMRRARPADIWLHVKDVPGSHVILRRPENVPPDTEPPEGVLADAALLAAYYSRARHSSQVPVDYTLRQHVWKPRGARPGMVLYDHHRTQYVTPPYELPERLQAT